MKGKETELKVALNIKANAIAKMPIITPRIANRIFIVMTQIIPSTSKVKINPGNLIDNFAHQKNTSDI